MEKEKKQIKISLKVAILLIAFFIAFLLLFTFYLIKNKTLNTKYNFEILKPNEYKKTTINGNTFYEKNNDSSWNGEFHVEHFSNYDKSKKSVNNTMKIVSYRGYLKTIFSLNSASSSEIKPYYTDKKCNYIILIASSGNQICNLDLKGCYKENNKVLIYGNETIQGNIAGGSGYFVAIPTNMSIFTKILYRECNTQKYTNNSSGSRISIDKPIIYLYPPTETEVSVKLLKDRNLTCSYPKYDKEWKVLAKPNGSLKDLSNNRNLYSLYYESKSDINFKVENDGFVVKSEDSSKFLEEKLALLGLTEIEAEEFIVYWLPKLESNKYNYIRFATQEEINKNMPLEINPSPDNTIRILMTFKGLDEPIKVTDQKLTTPNRTGFVAVEWGGTEIK